MDTFINNRTSLKTDSFGPIMKRFVLMASFVLLTNVLFAQSASDSNNSSAKKTEDVITQPEFKGGIEKMYEYISNNFVYPEEAQKRSVNGKMEVAGFV